MASSPFHVRCMYFKPRFCLWLPADDVLVSRGMDGSVRCEGDEGLDLREGARAWARHPCARPRRIRKLRVFSCALRLDHRSSIGDSVAETIGVFAEPELLCKDVTEDDKVQLILSFVRPCVILWLTKSACVRRQSLSRLCTTEGSESVVE